MWRKREEHLKVIISNKWTDTLCSLITKYGLIKVSIYCPKNKISENKRFQWNFQWVFDQMLWLQIPWAAQIDRLCDHVRCRASSRTACARTDAAAAKIDCRGDESGNEKWRQWQRKTFTGDDRQTEEAKADEPSNDALPCASWIHMAGIHCRRVRFFLLFYFWGPKT